MKNTQPFQAYILLCGVALASACGSKPSPPGRLENVGGSFGREPDASVSAGTGGGGGGGPEPEDAGLPDPERPDADVLDAGPDAQAPDDGAAPISEEGCLQGTLAERCDDGCPDIDEAASLLLAVDAEVVVRRRCEGADGAGYITIGGSFGLGEATGYIYDAESSELVSIYETSDVAEFCSETTPSAIGFWDRVIQDCASVNPDDITTPCEGGPGGPGGGPGPGPGGPGNGPKPPEECIFD